MRRPLRDFGRCVSDESNPFKNGAKAHSTHCAITCKTKDYDCIKCHLALFEAEDLADSSVGDSTSPP